MTADELASLTLEHLRAIRADQGEHRTVTGGRIQREIGRWGNNSPG